MENQEIEELKAKCDEYLAGWKRAQADYANLKKDTEKERAEFVKYANAKLLDALLPAIDQLEKALNFSPDISSLPEEEGNKIGAWINGVKAVKALWDNAFQSIGLIRVETTGEFDPKIHEAVSQKPSASVPKGHIISVEQDGWHLRDRLLRSAKVVVSSGIENERPPCEYPPT